MNTLNERRVRWLYPYGIIVITGIVGVSVDGAAQ